MKLNSRTAFRASLMSALMLIITIASSSLRADTGTCGGANITLPFIDVAAGNIFFCSIAEAYFSGLSNGTDSTHYSPAAAVPREQMAAFVTRTMDQSLKRGSRRAALNQFWTPTFSADNFGLTTVGTSPSFVASDGADIWVSSSTANTVSRVRASDGKLLETWTGATSAGGVLAAKGKIFVTCQTSGTLYEIDPTQAASAVTSLVFIIGSAPRGIAFDGQRIWMTTAGGVYIYTLNPVGVVLVSTGFTQPAGILFDGSNMWVTDNGTTPGELFKLDSNAGIIQTVAVGNNPLFPVFDGTNIWVPNNNSNTISVVRASTAATLATLTGNGLGGPYAIAFDGERILVTSPNADSLSLWKATDLSPLGAVDTGSAISPAGVCSDGLNFWIAMLDSAKLARF